MVKRCCVFNCNGNYDDNNKVKVFQLPKDPKERKRWTDAILRDNIPESHDTVICNVIGLVTIQPLSITVNYDLPIRHQYFLAYYQVCFLMLPRLHKALKWLSWLHVLNCKMRCNLLTN